jgi:hypothetical protein
VKGVKGAKVRMTPLGVTQEPENHMLIPSPPVSGGIRGPSWLFMDAGVFGSDADGAEPRSAPPESCQRPPGQRRISVICEARW